MKVNIEYFKYISIILVDYTPLLLIWFFKIDLYLHGEVVRAFYRVFGTTSGPISTGGRRVGTISHIYGPD